MGVQIFEKGRFAMNFCVVVVVVSCSFIHQTSSLPDVCLLELYILNPKPYMPIFLHLEL
jgi:hypothetical protein